MHSTFMRTTVTLDDDAYELAMLCAKGKGITLGAAISEFVRKATQSTKPEELSSNLQRLPNGMLTFKPRKDGRVITTELVKAALEEYDN